MEKYEIETRGHKWIPEEDGSPDIFAYDTGDSHTGPRCSVCGYGFCQNCQDLPDEDCDFIIDVTCSDVAVELPAKASVPNSACTQSAKQIPLNNQS